LVGCAVFASMWVLLPMDEYERSFVEFCRQANVVTGVAILVALYVVSTVLLIPGFANILVVIGGMVWGFPIGLLAAVIAYMLACNIAFLIGRYACQSKCQHVLRVDRYDDDEDTAYEQQSQFIPAKSIDILLDVDDDIEASTLQPNDIESEMNDNGAVVELRGIKARAGPVKMEEEEEESDPPSINKGKINWALRIAALDDALEESGYKVVFLTRLLPTPYIFVNYVLSLTKCSLRHFAVGSLFGLFPQQSLSVAIGVGIRDYSELKRSGSLTDFSERNGGSLRIALFFLFVLGLVLFVGATIYASRWSRRNVARYAAKRSADASIPTPHTHSSAGRSSSTK